MSRMVDLERDAEGYPLRCEGCGTMEALAGIQASGAMSCCPERKMRRDPNLSAWVDFVALALINSEQHALDCPKVDSMQDLRSPFDAVAYRAMAMVAISAMAELGWRPRR